MNTKVIQALSEDEMKKLDWIVVIDHSGSTSTASTRLKGKTRFEEMQETCTAIAREAGKYDDDGITVITFNNNAKVFDGVTADKVADVFKEITPRGGTILHNALDEVAKKARSSSKSVVALVFTDGEANDQDESISSLNAIGKEFGRPKIGFTIIQVGNDRDAKKFLDQIDNNMTVDVVGTVSEEDAENLGAAELAWLALNA